MSERIYPEERNVKTIAARLRELADAIDAAIEAGDESKLIAYWTIRNVYAEPTMSVGVGAIEHGDIIETVDVITVVTDMRGVTK